MGWLKLAFHRWNDVSGRSGRAEYAAFISLYIISLAFFVIGAEFADTGPSYSWSWLKIVLFYIPIIVLLGGTIPAFTVTIRRLHDFNMPGWLVLLFGSLLIPFLLIIPGSEEENNYGDPPGEPDEYLGKY